MRFLRLTTLWLALAATPAALALQGLASECISEVPARRPLPVEVVQRIDSLSKS